MSKKLITVLLTVLTVLILTGCNTDKKAVTETAEGFLNAMVSNDMKAASQFATEDFMNSKTMKLMDPEYLADTFYAAMGVEKEDMGEEAQKAVDEYVRKVISKAYKSFEIQDTKVMEETAAVTAKITLGYDPGASSGQSEETLDLIKQYQSEHYDELIAIYKDEGEKAMYKKMYNDLIPIVIGRMQEELENGAPSDEKTVLSLAKIDKKWLVLQRGRNMPPRILPLRSMPTRALPRTSRHRPAFLLRRTRKKEARREIRPAAAIPLRALKRQTQQKGRPATDGDSAETSGV